MKICQRNLFAFREYHRIRKVLRIYKRFFPISCIQEIWDEFRDSIYYLARYGPHEGIFEKLIAFTPIRQSTFDEINAKTGMACDRYRANAWSPAMLKLTFLGCCPLGYAVSGSVISSFYGTDIVKKAPYISAGNRNVLVVVASFVYVPNLC
ncbi:unnamed protein product [Dibothriocephalus latus]|uniref:Uncharacterized protein n=1 Tax=Dibothriocephalus latus TaxID=60516 RepID=A0A3P7QH53_DIBLA|nr:unnamed protein product [Dibothriocephalus latus]